MIVADTGAIVALIDADDAHHRELRELYRADPEKWLLPWSILPEVDYLVSKFVGKEAERAFVRDLARGAFRVEWGREEDVQRADALVRKYDGLGLGLVDATVMALSERKRAQAIATLDLRHFGVVALRNDPKLVPRDLPL